LTFDRAVGRQSSKDKLGYNVGSEYGYAGDVFFNEIFTAHKYKKQIDEGFNGPNESKSLYEHIIKESTNLLLRSHAPYYFNFGISYAYTDAILAKEFPKTEFYGIERTDAARIYNQLYFSDIKNLRISSGDVFDLFAKQRFDGGVFFHSRTLLLLPQEFIRKLYLSVREAGFTYILATEQFGISRETGLPYEFSYDYQDSVVYRHFMYIHNWPNILKECGFDLERIDSVKTEHPHADFRILSFCAKAMNETAD